MKNFRSAMRARVLLSLAALVALLAVAAPTAQAVPAIPTTVTPPTIRLGVVPHDHPAFLYDNGDTLYWCSGRLDPSFTVCQQAVVLPDGWGGF